MVGLHEKLVLVKGTGENGSFATSDFRKLSYNSVLFFSPIAISLGSYMDKAAGRRPCTGKKFTQDVSVLSR